LGGSNQPEAGEGGRASVGTKACLRKIFRAWSSKLLEKPVVVERKEGRGIRSAKGEGGQGGGNIIAAGGAKRKSFEIVRLQAWKNSRKGGGSH